MSRAVKLTDDETLVLPSSLVSTTDIARLIRELETVDYEFEQQRVHAPEAALVVPSLSRSLAGLCQENSLQIANIEQRTHLREQLVAAKEEAPVVHITFASEAEPDVLGQLVAWIRTNLHPLALITTGVQPTIVGGCIVRTPDHIYDFSLREHFRSHKSSFVSALQNVLARTPAIVAPAAETVAEGVVNG